MLSRPYRLKKDEDFNTVKEKGKLTQFDNMAISVYDRKDEDETRFGFVVSTKISKKASIRNKVKRAMSEAVRQNYFYLKKGYDCVFLAKPSIARKYTREIMGETEKLLKKANLYKQSK